MTEFSSYLRCGLAAIILALGAVSCGDSESFTVEGKIEDNATMNIRYIYYANGVLNRGITASREGKFEFKGISSTPTIVEITDNDYRSLGRLYLANGDRVECTLTRGNPYAIKVNGSDVSGRWAGFLNDNADALKSRAANETVEKYVSDHSDDVVSTLLMLTSYDSSRNALKADSIMSSISQDARPSSLVDGYNAMLQRLVAQSASEPVIAIPYFNRRDSLASFNPDSRPWSILVMSDEYSGRRDSIVPSLRRIRKLKKADDILIVDLSLDRDTIKWHKSTLNDSATWTQGWVAGSVASPGIDRLGVPSLPYFIIVDSTGVQTLRTTSVTAAENFIKDL